MLIAQITDLHIMPEGRLAFGEVDTSACLGRAIDRLNALDPIPDLALLTTRAFRASEAEVARNPRSRSAVLRVAEKQR